MNPPRSFINLDPMKMTETLFFLIAVAMVTSSLGAHAQSGSTSLGSGFKKPVSLSYENLTRCFPELQDESLSFKVDLNLLKDVVDKKFVTRESVLRQRKIQYLDSERQLMNLILRTKAVPGKKKETELILQQVDGKGVITDVKLTKSQSHNPKQDVINNFLLNATIKSDESLYNDTKLNGAVATYSRLFKDVQDYQLVDRMLQRSVSCEKRNDLGIICTCSKK